MPTVSFDNFVGLDKKSSETDLDLRFASNLKNLSTTKKPGALVKSGSYADVSSTLTGGALPASITLKSLTEIGLTSPSSKDVYLFHGQDGSSNNRIWMGQYYDGSAFQSGWQELTEREAGTTEAGSDADGVTSSDFTSSTDDYYNGWIIGVNISGTIRCAIITDYDGGTKVATVTTGALNGNAAGNTFIVSRSPIFATDSTQYTTVDDVIRWVQRNDGAIGMTGNQSQWPSQYQLWFGYISRTFGLTNPDAFANFWLDVQALLRPSTDCWALTQTSGGNLTDGNSYSVAFAYVYDGFQIGPLSTAKSITLSGNTRITATFNIPCLAQYDSSAAGYVTAYESGVSAVPPDGVGCPTGYCSQLISKRATGIRIYVTDTTDAPDTQSMESEKIFASSNTAEINFTMGSDGVLNLAVNIDDDDSGNSYITDVTAKSIRPNYKYGVGISTHFLGAAIRTHNGDRKNNNLIASVVDGAGVAAPDNFPGSNVINLGFFGSKEITGIAVQGDEGVDSSPKARAFVFSDDDYYIMDIVPGASFSHRLDNIGKKEGLYAPDSLVYAEGNWFGVSRNGFRMYTAQGAQILGEGLKTDFDSLTDPSECVAGYFKEERLILFHFATDTKTYALDLLAAQFGMFEYVYSDGLTWFAEQRNGGLLATDGSKIYDLENGTDQDGTAITPLVKTKRFDARAFGGNNGDETILTEGIITYRSDTAILLKAYKDNSGTAITFPAQNLAAQTTEVERRFLFPMGSHAREWEIEVTLNSTQASTNTILDFNGLTLRGYTKRRPS